MTVYDKTVRCNKVLQNKGRHKKNCFFSSENFERGEGGVSPNPKFPYQKKLKFVWIFSKGGGLTYFKRVLS